MKAKIFLFALAFATFSYTAQAQTPTIKQAQRGQQMRIKQGVRTGDLTMREAATLRREQLHIQQAKKVARRDGIIMPRERAMIKRQQRQASQHIRQERNDPQRRN